MKTRSAMDGTARQPAAGDGVLVNARWLEAHLHDPEVRVVEVDVSSRAYDEWHIDGAVLWNVYQDLKDADYRLLDTAAAERLLARSGISPGSTVVFYGYAPALGFWLMKLYGHHDVRILDCSRDAWRDEGHPVSSQPTEPARRRLRPARTRRTAACRVRGRAGRDRPPRQHPGGRAHLGRVPGGAILAVRGSGA